MITPKGDYSGIQFGPLMECNRNGFFASIELTAHLAPVFRYLELGIFHAHTLAGVMKALDRYGAPSYLDGVDLDPSPWGFSKESINNTLRDKLHWVHKPDSLTRTLAQINIFTCGSEKFLRTRVQEPTYNFCFIDACHSTACCTRDFILVEPLILPGGIIAFHDADEAQQGRDFERQYHCGIGIGVREAIHCLDLLNGKRPGWKLLDDTKPSDGVPGRGTVFVQKITP